MRKTIAAITGVIMAGEVSGGAGITYGSSAGWIGKRDIKSSGSW